MFVKYKTRMTGKGMICYGYLVKSIWNKKKKSPRQKLIKYLGRIDLKMSPKEEYPIKDKCAFCGSTLNLTYDHIIPLVKGGDNTAKNIQVLCMKCNLKKGKSMK